MPSFTRNTAGGKAVSGGALAPRSRRASTAQVSSYWSGGGLPSTPNVDWLVVAGGGGSGGGGSRVAGGGAGGMRTGSAYTVVSGTKYSVVIGAGGSGGAGSGSTFAIWNTTGGGHTPNTYESGQGGGSGSGASGNSSRGTGNAGGYSPVEGYDGGYGGDTGHSGGGAGGAASYGSPYAAGPGLASSITGTSVTYATGGVGEGAGGGSGNAAANTGNGGSAQSNTYNQGGSGIVVIAYPDTFAPAVLTNLTYTEPVRSGYRVYRITASASGTISF